MVDWLTVEVAVVWRLTLGGHVREVAHCSSGRGVVLAHRSGGRGGRLAHCSSGQGSWLAHCSGGQRRVRIVLLVRTSRILSS